MTVKSSNVLLADIPENPLLSENLVHRESASKCVIKLEAEIIADTQETPNRIFNLNLPKLIGAPIDQLLPEFQSDGNDSKLVIQSLLGQLILIPLIRELARHRRQGAHHYGHRVLGIAHLLL